jgi:hypothetical protein
MPRVHCRLKPRAHKAAENHRWLVGQLDGILAKWTGRHISRSYKNDDLQRFVKLCFAAADPNVGSGSIKKAIEAYIRLNPRHRTARAPITKNSALIFRRSFVRALSFFANKSI